MSQLTRPILPEAGPEAEAEARPRQAYWRPSLRITRLDFYIMAELLGPFLFGVVAFSGILLATVVLFDLVEKSVQYGIPMALAVRILVLRMPEMFFYTFPMSMLLGSLLATGRLSGDGELTAMRAMGVSFARILTPMLFAGLLVSIFTLAVEEYLVPETRFTSKQLMFTATTKSVMPVSRDNIFYNEFENSQLKRTFYARHFDGQTMDGVGVQEFKDGRLTHIITARRAYWGQTNWIFEQGNLYIIAEDGEYQHTMKFERYRVNLKHSLVELTRESRDPEDMSMSELRAHIQNMREAGQEPRGLEVRLYQKVAVPFAALVFVMIGAPLGARGQRTSAGLGFGLTLAAIFFYYSCMFMGLAMGQSGMISPLLGAWLPDLATAAAGLFLIRRVSR